MRVCRSFHDGCLFHDVKLFGRFATLFAVYDVFCVGWELHHTHTFNVLQAI